MNLQHLFLVRRNDNGQYYCGKQGSEWKDNPNFAVVIAEYNMDWAEHYFSAHDVEFIILNVIDFDD